MKRYIFSGIAALVLWSLNATTARADFVFNVSLDTSGLIGNPTLTGPFGIDFQLVSLGGSVTNTATISNIDLGGGVAMGGAALMNSSGSLTAGVGLDDSSVLSDFNQQFTPGSTLTFTVDLTTNVDATSPDAFSFAIYQGYGSASQAEISTTDLSGLDTLIAVSIDSSTPTVSAYAYYGADGITEYQTGYSSGQQPSAVPEPSALMMSVISLASLGMAAGYRRLPRRISAIDS